MTDLRIRDANIQVEGNESMVYWAFDHLAEKN